MSDTTYSQFGINSVSLVITEPQSRQLSPILKKAKSSDDITQRIDKFGNVIKSGKKNHKISFGEKNEIFLVENWKEYNVDTSNQEPPCLCVLQ